VTAAPQPLGRLATILDHTIRALAWIVQAATVAIYLGIGARPSLWQDVYDKAPVDTVFTGLFALALILFWGLCLWEEEQRYYDRLIQRSRRRLGLFSHFCLLFIAAAAASESPDRIGLWLGLGLACFSATTTWAAWMQTRFLPDEDQAVVDVIISREVAHRAAIHEAIERERRRERLTAIVGSLGYTLPSEAPAPAHTPAVKWTISKGKHTPLVYFIRNGNRMKIGTTTDLKRRIRTLALREENVALLVDGDHRREREYHKQFADLRIGRTEWFAYEGALADYVHTQITQKGQQK
jgi:hypothetical protein